MQVVEFETQVKLQELTEPFTFITNSKADSFDVKPIEFSIAG